ncbi:MAG: DNA gyrase subunit A [bacterium]|nr:DNA gyrase subunit A [bacterium]
MVDIGKIIKREISKEMQESYIDYAMSVIVMRALPDVRDGLKPVHRRILYTCHELGLRHTAKFVKSARIVGEVLGKYHPHGDVAVYDALVRMAQSFSLRYPLISGQGNFGSVDGDSAAAMRYTEARMSPIAEVMLADIDKETVGFVDTYDATRQEPTVLPSAVPNLLLNGSLGIAVGMATNIPPHNLGEVVDALIYLIENSDASVDELMDFVKGPDFPTGGFIYNEKEIRLAYATGRGAILTRGKAEIIDKKSSDGSEGRHGCQIIITEIPYQVNKAEMVEKIADLVKEKKIEGIKDIRDESDKDGMRVAIDLKNDAYPQKILNALYKFTDLEKNFNLNMLALIDGGIQPQVLSLKMVLEEYLKHREVIVRKRSEFDLARAKERAHILEGLKKALDHIDAVIQVIKKSKDREEAHKNLMAKFKFSALQSTAILEMKLQTLAGLEKQKIEDELKEKLALIRDLEALLKDKRKIFGVVKKELQEVRAKYGDERRTKVIKGAIHEIADEDIIPEEETIIALTRGGYIKRVKPETYKIQKRGGKGMIGMETKEEDVVEQFISANTHSDLLFFSDLGKVYQEKAYEIPEGSRVSKGKAIHNFVSLGAKEAINSILASPKRVKDQKKEGFLVMATKNGIIKKVEGAAFENVRRSGLVAIKLKSGDLLRWVKITHGKDEIIMVTKFGQAIRFAEKDVRPMGRGASGVKAMRLKKNDEIIGFNVIPEGEAGKAMHLLVVTEQGYGKRTPLKEYKRQHRGGAGIKTAKITSKNGFIVTTHIIAAETDLIAISQKGQVIRTGLGNIPVLGRATQGVRVMKLDTGDAVASITIL